MGVFASGRRAKAICDICGFTYKLHQLRDVYQFKRNTHVRACPTCWDPDHPQNDLPNVLRSLGPERIALKDPRPEVLATAYSCAFHPNSVSHGFVGKVLLNGVFSTSTIGVTFTDSHISVTSVTWNTPTRVTVGLSISSLALGAYVASITDGSLTHSALLTVI